MQNKETKQEQLSFHTENFRKRSRYTFVFVCMIAAFFVITVLNINTGNVHISVPKILRILFLSYGRYVCRVSSWQHYWAEHCLCPVSYYRHFSQIRSQDRLYLEFLPERRWLSH